MSIPATFVFIGITVTSAYKGVPDSEDKAFVFEKDEYSCLSQKTLPQNFTFVNTWAGRPALRVLSEDSFNCPNDFLFGLTRNLNRFEMMIWLFSDRTSYRVREACNKYTGTANWYATNITYLFTRKEKILFDCHYFPNDNDYYNVTYSVFTNSSCNFWFCMGHLEQFKRQPQYPVFTLPIDRGNYYLAADSLPEELQATDTGLAIDVLKASGQVFTIYKTPKRPIQTIEIKTSKHCSGMVISLGFNEMCTISVDLGANQVKYYVNGKSIIVGTRPDEVVITFTYSMAYLYTFQPLGFYPLTDCKFDTPLVENAEYNLKVWYDKTRSSLSCEMVKLRIMDAAAIKRWATTTMTTTSTTTAATPSPTEAPATELSASTASTKIWAVVAVVCFVAVVLIIVAVLVLIRWLKKC